MPCLRRAPLPVVIIACIFSPLAASQKPTGPQVQRPDRASGKQLSPQGIFQRVSPSVVVAESLDRNGSVVTLGSGVVVKRDLSADIFDRVAAESKGTKVVPTRSTAFVVTNRHVIEDGVTYRVEQNGKIWPAKLIRVDPDHDLAELSVDGLNAPAIQIRNSSTLAIGETVYAIGAPEGLELTISEGLISGLRNLGQGRVIQTSAAISPGSSGGGLFDSEGRLVGITTFYLQGDQALNFALPAESAAALDRQAITKSADVLSRFRQDPPTLQSMILTMVGLEAQKEGKYQNAAQFFQLAAKLWPDNWGAWCSLGFAQLQLGQYEEAVSAEMAAVHLKPDEAEEWEYLGEAYGHLAQWDSSAAADEQAIRLNPSDAVAWSNLASAYSKQGNYDKALAAVQEAVRLDPHSEPEWFKLGATYGELGQWNRAVEAEQSAISLNSADGNAWMVLGIAYYNLGQQAEVIRVYEKLKTFDPKLAEKFFETWVLP